MKIEIGKERVITEIPLPGSPFVARQYSLTGPLCIISRISGISPPSYSVMFLEGTGGPALGDVWHSLTHEKILSTFIPVQQAVTLTNEW